jgi:hypothetical protein
MNMSSLRRVHCRFFTVASLTFTTHIFRRNVIRAASSAVTCVFAPRMKLGVALSFSTQTSVLAGILSMYHPENRTTGWTKGGYARSATPRPSPPFFLALSAGKGQVSGIRGCDMHDRGNPFRR